MIGDSGPQFLQYQGFDSGAEEPFRQFAQFENSLSPSPSGMPPSSSTEFFVAGVSEGKPLAALVLRRTREFTPGNRAVFEVTEVRRETFAADLFEVPSGLRKETIPAPVVPIPRAR